MRVSEKKRRDPGGHRRVSIVKEVGKELLVVPCGGALNVILGAPKLQRRRGSIHWATNHYFRESQAGGRIKSVKVRERIQFKKENLANAFVFCFIKKRHDIVSPPIK